jgi:hypothetical protein
MKRKEALPRTVFDALQRGVFFRNINLDAVERILMYWSCMQYSRLML